MLAHLTMEMVKKVEMVQRDIPLLQSTSCIAILFICVSPSPRASPQYKRRRGRFAAVICGAADARGARFILKRPFVADGERGAAACLS